MFIESPLHPEIITGASGPEWDINHYKKVFSQFDEDGHISPLYAAPGDESAFMHFSLSSLYEKIGEPRALYLNKGFLSVMNTIDKEIPFSYLPQNYFGYIHFPEEFLFDGEDFVEGAYIYLGPSEALRVHGGKFGGKEVLAISYICKGRKSFGSLLVNTEDKKKLAEILSSYPCNHFTLDGEFDASEMFSHRESIFRTLVNSMLWFSTSSSDEARIEMIEPMERVHNKKLKKLKRKRVNCNFSTIPFVYVDETPLRRIMRYTKGNTLVSGHLRWQPCGLGRRDLKLIWISEHQRTYNK